MVEVLSIDEQKKRYFCLHGDARLSLDVSPAERDTYLCIYIAGATDRVIPYPMQILRRRRAAQGLSDSYGLNVFEPCALSLCSSRQHLVARQCPLLRIELYSIQKNSFGQLCNVPIGTGTLPFFEVVNQIAELDKGRRCILHVPLEITLYPYERYGYHNKGCVYLSFQGVGVSTTQYCLDQWKALQEGWKESFFECFAERENSIARKEIENVYRQLRTYRSYEGAYPSTFIENDSAISGILAYGRYALPSMNFYSGCFRRTTSPLLFENLLSFSLRRFFLRRDEFREALACPYGDVLLDPTHERYTDALSAISCMFSFGVTNVPYIDDAADTNRVSRAIFEVMRQNPHGLAFESYAQTPEPIVDFFKNQLTPEHDTMQPLLCAMCDAIVSPKEGSPPESNAKERRHRDLLRLFYAYLVYRRTDEYGYLVDLFKNACTVSSRDIIDVDRWNDAGSVGSGDCEDLTRYSMYLVEQFERTVESDPAHIQAVHPDLWTAYCVLQLYVPFCGTCLTSDGMLSATLASCEVHQCNLVRDKRTTKVHRTGRDFVYHHTLIFLPRKYVEERLYEYDITTQPLARDRDTGTPVLKPMQMKQHAQFQDLDALRSDPSFDAKTKVSGLLLDYVRVAYQNPKLYTPFMVAEPSGPITMYPIQYHETLFANKSRSAWIGFNKSHVDYLRLPRSIAKGQVQIDCANSGIEPFGKDIAYDDREWFNGFYKSFIHLFTYRYMFTDDNANFSYAMLVQPYNDREIYGFGVWMNDLVAQDQDVKITVSRTYTPDADTNWIRSLNNFEAGPITPWSPLELSLHDMCKDVYAKNESIETRIANQHEGYINSRDVVPLRIPKQSVERVQSLTQGDRILVIHLK